MRSLRLSYVKFSLHGTVLIYLKLYDKFPKTSIDAYNLCISQWEPSDSVVVDDYTREKM